MSSSPGPASLDKDAAEHESLKRIAISNLQSSPKKMKTATAEAESRHLDINVPEMASMSPEPTGPEQIIPLPILSREGPNEAQSSPALQTPVEVPLLIYCYFCRRN